jgi:hypothetical protein
MYRTFALERDVIHFSQKYQGVGTGGSGHCVLKSNNVPKCLRTGPASYCVCVYMFGLASQVKLKVSKILIKDLELCIKVEEHSIMKVRRMYQ